MIDNVVFSLLIVTVIFSIGLLLRAAVRSNRKYPFSERVCLMVLRFAAWLQCVGNAWDFAIVRYRIECRDICLDMESTTTRMEGAQSPAQTLDSTAHSLANGEPVLATDAEIREIRDAMDPGCTCSTGDCDQHPASQYTEKQALKRSPAL